MEAEALTGFVPVTLSETEKHLSRRVAVHLPGGEIRMYGLSVVSYSRANGLSIAPFSGETPSTVYHDNPLHLFMAERKLYEESAPLPEA